MAFSANITIVNGVKYQMRQIDAALREGLDMVVRYWHRRFLPIHFTEVASKRYGYQARSGENEQEYLPKNMAKSGQKDRFRMVKNRRYFWYKFHKLHHKKPLVWSGRSRDAATSSIRVRYKVNQQTSIISCLGVMTVPNYFYKYHVGGQTVAARPNAEGNMGPGSRRAYVMGKQPDKYNEMVRTTDEEREIMLGVLNKYIDWKMRTMPRKVETIAA